MQGWKDLQWQQLVVCHVACFKLAASCVHAEFAVRTAGSTVCGAVWMLCGCAVVRGGGLCVYLCAALQQAYQP